MPWTVQLQVKEQGRYRHRWTEEILNIMTNDKSFLGVEDLCSLTDLSSQQLTASGTIFEESEMFNFMIQRHC